MSETNIRLFCSDLDGTLLGNPEATRRFQAAWEALPADRRPLLAYASGRLVPDVRALLAGGLGPAPDFILGGVGTQIFDCRQGRYVEDFVRCFDDGWDLARLEQLVSEMPEISRQPDGFQHPHKSSWHWHHATPEAVEEMRQRLANAGLKVCVVYSSARDLDVLPARANKGNALRWLCERLGIPLNEVLVAGDTGNDASLFLLPGVNGIVVDNAQPELLETVVPVPVYYAPRILADGVLDGLANFGVIPAPPPPQAGKLSAGEIDPTLRMLFSGEMLVSLTKKQREFIGTGYRRALEALRKNITPLGFSACSLQDNEVTGTDVNYRSVWARDGAITLEATIDLDDEDIRAAQRNTLQTLLDHITPNGQIPANVRIDSGQPDYSGVGGICAIDAGMWVVIAFYHFVRKTGDFGFLNQYAGCLDKVMDWLRALDSNNDGLLEIPEAGDWTDLFGRSYHVLYDEVLWCRANVCYARLLEFQGQFERAADYLRWSQFIRGKILGRFWPSTTNPDPQSPATFADRQFALGDASYLLAEITPFSFSWRCDVLGNVLAFLTNVLDIDRARVAFKFMWGVGVNEPWPVTNLYPAVQSGDPDWRAYYTVNLLNLPHHYHNGGIWPFIGGMWVRFIHRLGLHEVACHELYRLAQLNHRGKNAEWEFNEWMHGRTGRPMGKCFQAWSAAAFIRACQELQMNPESLTQD